MAAKASRPQERHSRGKQLEKLVCAELKSRNRLSAARITARDIIKGCEGTERGARKGSISKGECK